MAEDSDDKTEEPTGKRLEDARKKGQIARSRELNTLLMLMVSATLLLMLGAQMGRDLLAIMKYNFSLERVVIMDPATTLIFLKRSVVDALLLVAPFIGVLLVSAFVGPLSMGGWNFSWEALEFNIGKLDPISGIPRLFGIKGVIELIKAIIKVTLIFIIAYLLFKMYLPEFVHLSDEPVDQAIFHALKIIAWGFLWLSASLLVVATIDVPYQLWSHSKELKMTKQEIRDESKESEGSPELKGRIRRMQMEMAQGRMMAEVPKADVIVTNPTHFAVALKYDPGKSSAPKVTAKGIDLIAAEIRNLAIGAKVPLVASPPLARALYYSTELEQEIPKGLFIAVAQVLAYIFQLKTAKEQGWNAPLPPQEIPIPKEYRK